MVTIEVDNPHATPAAANGAGWRFSDGSDTNDYHVSGGDKGRFFRGGRGCVGIAGDLGAVRRQVGPEVETALAALRDEVGRRAGETPEAAEVLRLDQKRDRLAAAVAGCAAAIRTARADLDAAASASGDEAALGRAASAFEQARGQEQVLRGQHAEAEQACAEARRRHGAALAGIAEEIVRREKAKLTERREAAWRRVLEAFAGESGELQLCADLATGLDKLQAAAAG
jgi:hypothetical protein